MSWLFEWNFERTKELKFETFRNTPKSLKRLKDKPTKLLFIILCECIISSIKYQVGIKYQVSYASVSYQVSNIK